MNRRQIKKTWKKSVIALKKKRIEQGAVCPKCFSPDYRGLAPDDMHPEHFYFFDKPYVYGDGRQPFFHFLAEKYQMNLVPAPLWICNSCGFLFQSEHDDKYCRWFRV